MVLSEKDRERVAAIRARSTKALQELYAQTLPLVEEFVKNKDTAKNYLQEAVIKLRDDIVASRLTLAGHKSLRDYLAHLCKERLTKEERDREVEKKLVESLETKENDGWAFYYMQMHFFPTVKRQVMQYGGSEEEAKDIMMDGIEALIRNVRDGAYVYKDNAKLKTYFIQICRNKWFDYSKRKNRAKPISLFSDLNLEDYESNYFYEFNDDLLNDRQRIVAELFNKSTETCRQVLSYFYYDELSHEDIAERMGFSGAESSKTQKNKCLRKLKIALRNIFDPTEVQDLKTN